MRPLLFALVLALVAGACSDNTSSAPSGGSSGVPNGSSTSSSSGSSGKTSSSSSGTVDPEEDGGDPGPKPKPDAGPPGTNPVRIVAGNITSGTKQSYDSGEGTRIFQGLKPDVALVQEFNFGNNSTGAIRGWVDDAFGADYNYYREPSGDIPNGVVTRYPILTSGSWASQAPNRGFAYAKIDAPGGHALWAVSVHLLTTSSTIRDAEADELKTELKKVVKSGDYIVIGGDFNTDTRTETCLTTINEIVDAANSHAADGDGKEGTNATRAKPYDWVLASPDLVAKQVPTVIGTNTFAKGLVFDSRVFKPITDVPPVKAGDSGGTNMQHMAVVKDFKL